MPRPRSSATASTLIACLLLTGCGGGGGENAEQMADESQQAGNDTSVTEPAKPKFAAVSLGGGNSDSAPNGGEKITYTTEDVRKALNPLQVMVGSWNGTLQRKQNFDALNWRWDFTDRKQPALYFETDKGLVVKSGKLTFFPGEKTFELVVVDTDDRERTLDGAFTEEPEKVPGDDGKLNMTYKLELTEANPPEGEKAWQVTFNQQSNNRLLVELGEKRGEMFARFETFAVQREGTSFAKSFDDYGDRTCIVSAGLGTSTVSHDGKTYYVCCSGCRAAFEDDPEYWIAKALEREKDE